jgi:hypothetical protein
MGVSVVGGKYVAVGLVVVGVIALGHLGSVDPG